MRRVILLGVCVAALVAGGYWLGRSSASPPPAATPTVAPRSATLPVAAPRALPAPVLATRVSDPTLVADLADPDPKVRRAALREAVRTPDVDPQLLLTASRDADLEVSVAATIELGKAYARGEVAVGELIARAQDRSLPDKVRLSALTGVGTVASAEAVDLLSTLATGATPGERAAAALLLRHQDLARAVPLLIGMLADSDAHVRDSAHDSLKARARGRDFGEDAAAWRAWWQGRMAP